MIYIIKILYLSTCIVFISYSCSSASDISLGSSLSSSYKEQPKHHKQRKLSVQWNPNISKTLESRRASVSPVFTSYNTNRMIVEDSTNQPSSDMDMHRDTSKTASERIGIIRRTLRRVSVSNAPVQPPKHSIMAGFAGFLNMTTATCNTGVPEERRMSIPIAVDEGPTGTDSPKKNLPYSNLPPVALSTIRLQQDSFGSNSSSSGSICTAGVGKLRTRWSDTNVIESKNRNIKSCDKQGNAESHVSLSSSMPRPHYSQSICITMKDTHKVTTPPSTNKPNIGDIKVPLVRSRMRSDSIASAYTVKEETLLEDGGENRARNNSEPYVFIVTGKMVLDVINVAGIL